MTLNEYTVKVNGRDTTLQLDDDDAVRWGVKESGRQSKRPMGAQPKEPNES